jgi:hypothetical protein
MIEFPVWFLRLIVYGGLVFSLLGAGTLLTLLIIDIKKRRLW